MILEDVMRLHEAGTPHAASGRWIMAGTNTKFSSWGLRAAVGFAMGALVACSENETA